MGSFEGEVRRLRDGESTYEEFVHATQDRWQALARWLMRKWKVPVWVEAEDIVQELLLGAWHGLWEYEDTRGHRTLVGHVEYVAVDKAKKKMHKLRGALLHGNADAATGNIDMPFCMWGEDADHKVETRMSIAPPQETTMLHREENAAKMMRLCQSVEEMLIIQAFAITENLQASVTLVYRDEEARALLRLESEEHAAEVLGRAAHSVARRIEQQAA
jgi:DNA-directed RNA polymerase specialized sigma24 family protein